ncbi:MAG: yddE [Acidimicrobiales bacterium]|nr:yddE [Acidimicrobiales bacterium]
MTVPLLQIDAFTDRPFSGNPAAVALLQEPAEAAWMQAVAAEMNLAETAFVTPAVDGVHGLRWFTPTVEVDLCGHATLASAHALWSTGRAATGDVLRFATRSGELRAAPDGDRIALDLPINRPTEGAAPPGFLEALGASPLRVALSPGWVLVEVATETEVRSLAPNFKALGAHPVAIVTAPAAHAPFDIASRVFGPSVGIDEDPVTGSAHCILAPWWAPRLGRNEIRARQVSARGGDLHVRLDGDRVSVAGNAVTVLEGELIA